MSYYFVKINTLLGKNMFLVVLSGLFFGFLFPLNDSSILRIWVIFLFGYMTFVTALTTSFLNFLKIMNRPWIPLWILALVHFIAPLIAWIIGDIFYADNFYIKIGYLVGASIPIGVTSLIWTSIVKGDSAISLVAIILDTFIVPMFLPIFFIIFIGQNMKFDYFKMIKELLIMVTVPSLIGMLLTDITHGRISSFAKGIGGISSKIALFLVIFINAAIVMPKIIWDILIIKMLLVSFLVVASGYFTGYLGSLCLKNRTYETTMTMIYNVGIRNNACGLMVALTYFPPEAAIPITLAMLFQQPIATIIPYLFRKKLFNKEKYKHE